MRSDESLNDAVEWFKQRNIPLYGINTNPTQSTWTKSPKAFGQLIIDDIALRIPLVENIEMFYGMEEYQNLPESKRPYVDWIQTRHLLKQKGYL